MSFWDKALNGGRTQVSSPPPSLPQNSGPWWNTQFIPTPQPSQQQVVPQQQTPQGFPPTQDVYVTTKATSASKVDRCPSCGSPNYFQASANTAMRCLQCGHNSAGIDLGGYGAGMGITSSGPTIMAHQVAGQSTNMRAILSNITEHIG